MLVGSFGLLLGSLISISRRSAFPQDSSLLSLQAGLPPRWVYVVSRVDPAERMLPSPSLQGEPSRAEPRTPALSPKPVRRALVTEPWAYRLPHPTPGKTQTKNSASLLLPHTLLALKEGPRFVPKLPHGLKNVSQIPSLKQNT